MSCKKCNCSSNLITLRKKDTYCKECFLTNINHKFRACIGKNKILSRNERVLVCSSGGKASSTLLDLINFGLSQDRHKMLRIKPIILHVIDPLNNPKSMELSHSVINMCKLIDMELYIIHMSQYFNDDIKLPPPFTISEACQKEQNRYICMMNDIHSTVRTDFLFKIKRNLFIKAADALQCSYIFTGETTTTLAVNLLSNLAIGRGSQIENDIGFCDSRNETVKIIRPLKDITNEELNYYVNIKNIECSHENKENGISLQSLIQSFVVDLQDNFPATISTVCKTADKIGTEELNETQNKCVFCESKLRAGPQPLTALEATNFSKTISHTKPAPNLDCVTEDLSMFPFINESLCFSCSRSYNELDKNIIPEHIVSVLNK